MSKDPDKSIQPQKCEMNEPSLSDRFKYLVGNSLHADFAFIIEDDNVEIPAHKLIVATASPVLHKMVYGTDTFCSTNSIKVSGITKESFLEILGYIYTDKININNDNVFAILNKANYFGLSFIETKCVNYLKNNLNNETVTWMYHQTFHSCWSPELLNDCLKLIQTDPTSFFTAKEFQSVSADAFKQILKLDAINCTEMDLFEATLKLAKAHCIAAGLEPTGANQRKILDGAEKLLRLETLTKCEYDYCRSLQLDFFSSSEIERTYATIDRQLPKAVASRKSYTYNSKFV